MKIVIVGGGVIGSSTAYYLSKFPDLEITIIEQTAIACGASGSSGGFLARDWTESPQKILSERSFQLHKELSSLGNYGYRPVETLSVQAHGQSKVLNWIDGKVSASVIGTHETTAQIIPRLFTKFMFEQSRANLIIGIVSKLEMEEGCVKNVILEDSTKIPADIVVLAMGPWTNLTWNDEWVHLPKVSTQRVHSIVLKPTFDVTNHVLFTSSFGVEPEIVPRPDGTIYISGVFDDVPLPKTQNEVKPNQEAGKKILDSVKPFSSMLSETPISLLQACYLPYSDDGLPIIGKINNNLYIGTGHGCWGMLHGPVTGEILADLIILGKSKIDIRAFDPLRFSY